MVNFSLSGRHLIAGPAVDDADAVRTQSHGGSRRVHGHVPGAQDHDVFAVRNRGVHLRKQVGFHEIGPCKILIGGKNTDQVFPRYVHEFRKTGSHAQINGIIAFIKELIQGDGSSHHLVAGHFGAEFFQKGHFGKNNLLGKPEFRNAVNQNAAWLMKGFQNRHIMAFTDQIARHCQSRWPGANNRNFFPGRLILGWQLAGAVHPLVIRDKAFQVSNGHRVPFFADDAVPFTLNLLRAYPAADSRKAVLRPQIADGTGHISFGNQVDEPGDVHTHRTTFNAARFFALKTSAGFSHGLFHGVTRWNFLKISSSDFRFLFRHGLPGSCFFGFCFFCHNILHSNYPFVITNL